MKLFRRNAAGSVSAPSSAVFFFVLLILLTSCEPPGKPESNSEEAAQVADFKTLFGQNCAGCHGENGKNGAVRPLNDPLYLAIIPKQELRKVIENGRAGTPMPAWARSRGGPLDPQQITALVDGIEQTWARPVDVRDAPAYIAGARRGDSDAGKKLFSMNCFMCHGPGAPIGPVTEPAFLSLTTDQGLRASIIAGRPDFGMPNYQHLKLGRGLSDQNITDLVAYLSSLRPASAISEGGERGGR